MLIPLICLVIGLLAGAIFTTILVLKQDAKRKRSQSIFESEMKRRLDALEQDDVDVDNELARLDLLVRLSGGYENLWSLNNLYTPVYAAIKRYLDTCLSESIREGGRGRCKDFDKFFNHIYRKLAKNNERDDMLNVLHFCVETQRYLKKNYCHNSPDLGKLVDYLNCVFSWSHQMVKFKKEGQDRLSAQITKTIDDLMGTHLGTNYGINYDATLSIIRELANVPPRKIRLTAKLDPVKKPSP